jgi:hypothetical protein
MFSIGLNKAVVLDVTLHTFSKLQLTVKAWLPSLKSQAIATHLSPSIAMHEPPLISLDPHQDREMRYG